MSAVVNNIRIYWLQWLLVGFSSMNALIAAFMVQTYHLSFFSLSREDKIMVGVGCLYIWTGYMMALVSTIGKRAARNETLFDDDKDIPLPDGPKPQIKQT